MRRLVDLREEVGHPDKAGEPLPQDQAAARAGVTARQWQRWESGASVPYARNLSAVAEAFGFDVREFYEGPAGTEPAGVPDPFVRGSIEDRVERMERRLDEHAERVESLLEVQNSLLSRQSQILEAIEAAIVRDDETSRRLADEGDQFAERLLALARQELRDEPPSPAPARRKRAKSAIRQG